MKHIRFSLVVCIGLVVVALAVAGTASATTSVPFKGGYSGAATVSFPSVLITASGEATHLGSSAETVSLTVGPSPVPLCLTNHGTAVLTAANGDRVFLAASGTTCLNPSTGLVSLSGTQTITGGTGRFAGASGTLTVSGTANPATDALTYTLKGSISY
jgi:hypothetical protein